MARFNGDCNSSECKQAIATILNVVFGLDESRAHQFWQSRIKDLIVKKFVAFKSSILSSDEQHETHDLRHSLVRALPQFYDELLKRISVWCGLTLNCRTTSDMRTMFYHLYDIRPRFDDDGYRQNYGDDDQELCSSIENHSAPFLKQRLEQRLVFAAADIQAIDARLKSVSYTQFERGYCELEAVCTTAGLRWEDNKVLTSGLELLHNNDSSSNATVIVTEPSERKAKALYVSAREATRSLRHAVQVAPYDVQAWDLFVCSLMVLAQLIPYTQKHTSKFAHQAIFVQHDSGPSDWFSPYTSIGELVRLSKYLIDFYKKMGIAPTTRATEMRVHNVKSILLDKHIRGSAPDTGLLRRGDEYTINDLAAALLSISYDAAQPDLLRALIGRSAELDQATFTRMCVLLVRYTKPSASCKYWAKASDTLMSLGMNTAAFEAFRIVCERQSELDDASTELDDNAYGTFERGCLSLVNQELDEVPYMLGSDYGSVATTLDLSFNNLRCLSIYLSIYLSGELLLRLSLVVAVDVRRLFAA
jgi:hypothetical protein